MFIWTRNSLSKKMTTWLNRADVNLVRRKVKLQIRKCVLRNPLVAGKIFHLLDYLIKDLIF